MADPAGVGAVVVLPTVLAVDDWLAGRLAARRGVAALARRLRVVVPSPQDRANRAAQLVALAGTALGVRVQSYGGLAQELLGGEPSAGVLVEVLVRRLARGRPDLRHYAGRYDGGADALIPAVRNLLAAGLDEVTLEPALEALEHDPGGRSRRAEEVLRLAAAVRMVLDAGGLAVPADILRRAAQRLSSGSTFDDECVCVGLPADVAGDDLLEALLAQGATLVVAAAESGPRSQLRARLGRLGVGVDLQPPPPASLRLVAADADAEARLVADLVGDAIAAGTAPESVAVALCDPAGLATRLAGALRDAGVPFAASGFAGGPDGRWRRAASLATLLESGGRARVGDLVRVLGATPELDEVAVVLAARGLDSIEHLAHWDLAAVRVPEGGFVLPWVAAQDPLEASADESLLESAADEGDLADVPGSTLQVPTRQKVARERVEVLVAVASGVLQALAPLRRPGTLADGAAAVRAALGALGIAGEPLGGALEEAVEEALEALAEEIPGGLQLEADELARLIAQRLRVARPSLAADGGGVRLLTPDQAAARSWGFLVVAGASSAALEAGSEDPVLPRSVGRRLVAVLPDLAVDDTAQRSDTMVALLGAAAEVVTTRSARSARGELVSGLRLFGEVEVEATPRPSWREQLLTAASAGEGASALELALGSAGELAVFPGLAQLRTTKARHFDAETGPPGAHLGAVAPRAGVLWATRLEALGRCPWQVYLERELGLVPRPEGIDSLPRLDERLVGTVVHAALEKLVTTTAGAGRALCWPDQLHTVVGPLATATAHEEGVPLLAGPLAVRGVVALERLRGIAGFGPGAPVTASELVGTAEVGGERVAFRADLVVPRAGGALWVDIKLARPPLLGKGGADEVVLRGVETGTRLQVPLYARAAGAVGGSYLYLGESADDAARVIAVPHDAPALASALEETVARLAAMWRSGCLVPRLVDPSLEVEGPACRRCRVAEACARGDSLVRARLVRWLEDPATGEGGAAAGLVAVATHFRGGES